MEKQFRINGSYQAKYPNGQYTGSLGISTNIEADCEQTAAMLVANKTKEYYGYVDFRWININVQKLAVPV